MQVIRQSNLSDIDAIMDIWLDTNIAAHDFISKEYWLNNVETVMAMLPDAEILIYEDDEIKGFVGITDKVNIAGLFVSKQFQNCGIGSKLIEVCKTRYPILTLDVYVKNDKAVSFYCKQGFRIVGEKENGDTKELEYTMQWAV
jgi:putative acetyltransferase